MCLQCTVSHNTHQVGLVHLSVDCWVGGLCYAAVIVCHIAFASVTISSSASPLLALQFSLIAMGSPARAIALGSPATPEGLGRPVDVDAFVLPEGVTEEFINFLKSVDAPEVRSMDLLCAVARAFLANGVGSKLEMVGVERADLTTSTLRLVLHVQSASCFIFILPRWTGA